MLLWILLGAGLGSVILGKVIDNEFFMGLGGLVILSTIVVGPVNITGYADRVASYRNADTKIELAQAEFDILSTELKDIDKTDFNTALLNADTPYASLIQARTKLRKDLLQYKTTKVHYKKEIDAYRLGVFSFVTTFVDDEGI